MATSRPGFRIEVVFCLIALTMQGSKQDAATAYDTVHESGWDAARAFPVYTSESVETCSSVLSAQLDRCRSMMAKAVAKSYLAADQVQFRKGELWEDRHHLLAELAEKVRAKAAREAESWDETVSVIERLFAPFTLKGSEPPFIQRITGDDGQTPEGGTDDSSSPSACSEKRALQLEHGREQTSTAAERIDAEREGSSSLEDHSQASSAMPELDSQRATTALSTRKWGSSEVDRSWWAVPYVPDPKAGSSSASGALGAEYNDWRQVLAHAARDWTDFGATPRASVYQPIVEQLLANLPPETAGGRVLVPGCGTARLAFDLAISGYSVEASDVSVTTMAAASAILNDQMRWVERKSASTTLDAEAEAGRSGTERTGMYPLLLASLNAQVPQSTLLHRHSLPDVDPAQLSSCRDRLWLHLGSFEASYNTPRHDGSAKASFDAVATCFFLDCTEDIIASIAVIRHVLRRGGFWVNAGPLDYHQASTLALDAEHLREVIGIAGFEVLSWKEVREEWDGGVSLRRTAYRPIIFTAKAV